MRAKHLIAKLYDVAGDDWVDLDLALLRAGVSLSWREKLKLLLELREEFQLVYNASTDSFLIRRKEERTGEASNSIQKVVEVIRGVEQMPKPQFYNVLEELVGDRARVVYERLLRDGVIEEVNVRGIALVKVRKS